HLAEAQAILGHERLTRDYWSSGGPPLPLHERIELVWRLEILRRRPTDDATWRDLAREADRTLEHPEFQTTWMHHWFGVAVGPGRAPGQGRAAGRAIARAPGGTRRRLLVHAGGVHPRG